MALSYLDANRYDKVLKWKHSIDPSKYDINCTIHLPTSSIIVSEFGDLKVTEIRKPQKHFTDEEIKQVIAEYENGMTTYQLAENMDAINKR